MNEKNTYSNYNINGSSNLNSLTEVTNYLTSTKISKSLNGVLVFNNFTRSDSDTLVISDDKISDLFGNSANRYVSVGNTWGNCTVSAHLDTYAPTTGYTYNDVLMLTCQSGIDYYMNGKGLVAEKSHSSDSSEYRIILKNSI